MKSASEYSNSAKHSEIRSFSLRFCDYLALIIKRNRMKRITLSLITLALCISAYCQGNRIVCDETCRIEYLKTEANTVVI